MDKKSSTRGIFFFIYALISLYFLWQIIPQVLYSSQINSTTGVSRIFHTETTQEDTKETKASAGEPMGTYKSSPPEDNTFWAKVVVAVLAIGAALYFILRKKKQKENIKQRKKK